MLRIDFEKGPMKFDIIQNMPCSQLLNINSNIIRLIYYNIHTIQLLNNYTVLTIKCAKLQNKLHNCLLFWSQ